MDMRESFKSWHSALPAILLVGFLFTVFLLFASPAQAFGEPDGSAPTSDEEKGAQVLTLDGSADRAEGGDRSATSLSTKSERIIASGTWGTCPWEIDSSFVLTVHPGEGEQSNYWDSACPWADYNSDIERIVFLEEQGAKVVAPEDCSNLFSGLAYLETIDFSGFDNANVTDMSSMFSGCSKLASLDVSGWDTSKVTSMNSMFRFCSSLASLDVSGWDTSKVTSMYGMFSGCSSLESLDVSGWDTSKVSSMYITFSGCTSLASLDVSGWDTSKVTSMDSMFYRCSKLASLDVSGWDTSKVTSMGGVFADCTSIASLDVSGWDTSRVTDMSSIFSGCSSLASLDVSGWDTYKVTSMYGMFSGCSKLASLDVSGWDTTRVTDTSEMFYGCSKLKKINLGPAFHFADDSYYYNCLPDGIWIGPGGSMTAKELAETYNGSTMAGLYVRKIDVADDGLKVAVPSCTYTGSPLKPLPTVTMNGKKLRANKDYTVSYAKNTNAGSAKMTIKGKGEYAGSTTKTFTIKPASIKSATVTGITNKIYTGKTITQRPVVKLPIGGATKTLKAGTDYKIYTHGPDYRGVGNATVEITGVGNYTGRLSKTYIVKRWNRLAGSTALQTMQKILQYFESTDPDEYDSWSRGAIVTTNALASGSTAPGYKDALAAAALAGTMGAPMLTTSKNALSPETRSELKRMGVWNVFIVGSENEVSANVEKQIEAAGMLAWRIAGKSPSERAVAAAKTMSSRSDTVIIATQNTFKDALPISPYAYATESPILYAETNKKLSKATLDYIKNIGFEKAIIVGGPVALPKSIETQLTGAGIKANSITRLAGSNQYKTARIIAEWATGKLKNGTGGSGLYQYAKVKFQPSVKLSANKLGVARADDNKIGWKDALAGTCRCGEKKSVLLLADKVNSAQAQAFIKANKSKITYGYVFGGTSAVPKAVMDKLVNASL